MHKGQRLHDAAKYEILAAAYSSGEAREGTRVNSNSVGGYRTKTVRAGDFLYISCYPLIGYNANREQKKRLEEFKAERLKNSKLRLKYTRYNNSRRMTELEQLVHANMEPGDLHITCTYAMQDYRERKNLVFRTRDDAKRDSYNFLRRVKYFLKKMGCDTSKFRWICVTVTKRSLRESANPRPDVHHHHILVHGIPAEFRNDVENLWKLGFCNTTRIQDSENGFAALAAYVARQESSFNGENGGERSYTTSRNIIRPKITTADHKISRRRAARIAADVQNSGKEIFEKLFPGFRLVEDAPRAIVSDYVTGTYIRAKLRRMRN